MLATVPCKHLKEVGSVSRVMLHHPTASLVFEIQYLCPHLPTTAAKSAGFQSRKDVAIWRSLIMPADWDKTTMTDNADYVEGWKEMQEDWPLQDADELLAEVKKVRTLQHCRGQTTTHTLSATL